MATIQPFDDSARALITAVAAGGARDAELVALFLGHLGLKGTPEKPLLLPRGFLLRLATGVRLVAWEALGVFFHREIGLPEAREVLRGAFRFVAEPDAYSNELDLAVLRLSIERFSWYGGPELGADIALGDVEEDAALEALADFLWSQSRR
jgi:hypothetical protein